MPRLTTLQVYKSHNERINRAPEGSFYALCSPRYGKRPKSCLKCREIFQSEGNRICSRCNEERFRKDYYTRKEQRA